MNNSKQSSLIQFFVSSLFRDFKGIDRVAVLFARSATDCCMVVADRDTSAEESIERVVAGGSRPLAYRVFGYDGQEDTKLFPGFNPPRQAEVLAECERLINEGLKDDFYGGEEGDKSN